MYSERPISSPTKMTRGRNAPCVVFGTAARAMLSDEEGLPIHAYEKPQSSLRGIGSTLFPQAKRVATPRHGPPEAFYQGMPMGFGTNRGRAARLGGKGSKPAGSGACDIHAYSTPSSTLRPNGMPAWGKNAQRAKDRKTEKVTPRDAADQQLRAMKAAARMAAGQGAGNITMHAEPEIVRYIASSTMDAGLAVSAGTRSVTFDELPRKDRFDKGRPVNPSGDPVPPVRFGEARIDRL